LAWFRRERAPLQRSDKESRVPEGLWVKCPGCKEMLYRKEVVGNLHVCPKCAHHFRVSARERLDLLLDPGWTEFDGDLVSLDPLAFRDTKEYKARLIEAKAKTRSADAIVTAEGTMEGRAVVVGAMEYNFIGGSMGVVVGEKVTRAIEKGFETRRPVIVVSCSGGARMMEGTLSLMQMAKISAALARLDSAAIPFISVLTDPTTGGVTASYAMLGDLNVAEPKALIGFAGPRVIEQTIRQKLPAGFQRSEFLLQHGMLDMIVDRREMKKTVARCLDLLIDVA
jgi:acetyl-CoA carboxylase carboxyl transferase subunit beta